MTDLDHASVDGHWHDRLVGMLSDRLRARRHAGRVIAPTDVLMPNGVILVAIVEGGLAGDRVTVSDGGAALAQLGDAGLSLADQGIAKVRAAARKRGLSMEGSVLRSHPVPLEEAEVEVIRLANAAREIADLAFQSTRKQERARYRDRIQIELHRIFSEASVQSHAPLRGYSEETLHFDWVVTMPGGSQLALDAPVPEHSSVASVVMRQMDLAAMRPGRIVQAIAYDDRDAWPSSAIRQLQLARVPVIAAESLEPGLRKLADKERPGG
ncbi:MAG: hypothetical protein K2X74_13165 [Acetobacteraceae bacterium]|nr:hypothetical protein [Acetobacteraceae bacterium]